MVYPRGMDFFYIIASLSKKRPIVSNEITEVQTLAPFADSDSIIGTIEVVEETNDPTGATAAVAVSSAAGVALTNGVSVIYANAVLSPVTDTNKLHFTMVVASAALTTALTATENEYIEAYLEVRIQAGTQDILLLREPVLIQKAASSSGALAVVPASIAGLVVNSNITSLRGEATSLEAMAILPLPLLTFVIIAITTGGIRSQSTWQVMPGVADVDNPDGEVAALDTITKHYQKVGGF